MKKWILSIILLTKTTLVLAQSTWTGATGSMNTATNWNPNGVPAPGTVLVFPNTATTFVVINDIGSFQIANFTITGSGTPYSFTGMPFTTALPGGANGNIIFTNSGNSIAVSGITNMGTLNFTSVASPGNTISSPIDGNLASNVLAVNAGLLIFSGTNTYAGVTNINGAGTILRASTTSVFSPASNVVVGAAATLDLAGHANSVGGLAGQTGSFVTLGAATLTVAGNGAYPFYGTISGTGGMTFSQGTNSLMASQSGGMNTYMGATTIMGLAAPALPVTLNVFNANDLGSTSSVIFAGLGGTLVFGTTNTYSTPITVNAPAVIRPNNFTVTLNGGISGSSSLTTNGIGKVIVTGSTVGFTGPITIKGGTLNMNSLGGTTSLTFSSFGGTFQAGVGFTGITIPITLSTQGTIDTNGLSFSATGAIGGGFPLAKTGAGTLTLTSTSNNYSGQTIIQQGTLSATSTTFSSLSPQLVFSGAGTGIFQAGSTFASPTFLTGGVVFTTSGTINTNGNPVTIPSVVSGSSTSTFTKAGMGTLTLNGANLYTGPTVVSAGTLQAGSTSAFGVNSAVTVSSTGTLALGTFSNTIGSLTGAAGGIVNLGTATLTVANGNGLTFAGNITDTSGGGLNLTTGSLTLSGSNTYSGPTHVNGGSLIASNGNLSPFGTNSAITVSNISQSTVLNFGTVAAAGINLGSTASLTNMQDIEADFSSVTGNGISLNTFTQVGANSTLTLNLPGVPAMSFVGFNATGAVAIAGSLTVTGLSAPVMGQQIILLKGSSVSGSFATSEIPANFTLMQNATQVYLQAGSSGGTFFWTGTTNTLMNTGTNWQGNTAPVSGQPLSFLSSIAPIGKRTAVNDIPGSYTLSSTGLGLTVDSAGFTISGNPFIVAAGGATIDFAGSSTAASTISNPFTLNGIASIIGDDFSAPILSGAFSGSGGITLSIASLVLQNSGNTYMGTTTIGNQATLYAGVMNAFSSSSPISLASGGTLSLVSPAGTPFNCAVPSVSGGDFTSSIILGSATLTITNPGTSTLPATITSTGGGLSLSAGTLNLTGTSPGFSSKTSPATITVSSGATLNGADAAFGSADEAYINLNLSGMFNLTSGNLTTNTLTGNGTFNLEDSTTLTTAGTSTFSGTISGSGGLIVAGLGTLTLNGSNSYTGPTNISEGKLLAGSTSAFSAHSAVVIEADSTLDLGTFNNTIASLTGVLGSDVNLGPATLTIADGSGLIFSGDIFGTAGGGLTLTAGLLILNGTNSYPGATTINGGTLQAGSTSAISEHSAVTVHSGATLQFGTFANTVSSLTNAGTVSTSATVTAGSYTDSSGALILDIPTNAASPLGNIFASGTIALGGTLTVTNTGGFVPTEGQALTLLQSTSSLTGAFSTFSIPSNFALSYDYANNRVHLIGITPAPPPSPSMPANVAAAVAGLFTGPSQAAFTSVSQRSVFVTRKCYQLHSRFAGLQAKPNAEVASNYEASNETIMGLGDTVQGIQPQTQRKAEQLSEKLVESEKPLAKPGSVYVGPIASFGHVKKHNQQPGFGYQSVGILAGADYATSDSTYYFGVGAIADYRRIGGERQFKTQEAHGSIYSTIIPKIFPDLAIDAILGIGYNWNKLRRHAGPGNTLTALGKSHDTIFDAFIDAEYTFSRRSYSSMPKNLYLVPLASLQFVNDRAGGFTEKGAGIFDVKVRAKTFRSLTSVLGTRVDYLYVGSNFTIRSEFDAGWQREYLNQNPTISFLPFNVARTSTHVTAFGASPNSLLLAVDFLATFKRYSLLKFETTASYTLNHRYYDLSFYFGVGGDF